MKRLERIKEKFYKRIYSETPRTDVHYLITEVEHLRKAYVRLLSKDEQTSSVCPSCGGYADNGFPRSLPVTPYSCSSCFLPAPLEDDE